MIDGAGRRAQISSVVFVVSSDVLSYSTRACVCACACTFINCFRNLTRPIGPRHSKASSAHVAEKRCGNNIAHLEFTTRRTTSVADRPDSCGNSDSLFSPVPLAASIYRRNVQRRLCKVRASERVSERTKERTTYLPIYLSRFAQQAASKHCSDLWIFLSPQALSPLLPRIRAASVNSAPLNPSGRLVRHSARRSSRPMSLTFLAHRCFS